MTGWIAIALALCVVSIAVKDINAAVTTGGFAIAALGWLWAFGIETKCGVTTVKGTPCRIGTTGVLFGCTRYHYWTKLQAHLGMHPYVPVTQDDRRAPRSPVQAGRQPGGVEQVVGVAESRPDRIMFWVPVWGLGVAAVSMTTDLIGLFD